jgi:hypothetical protein
MQRASRAVTSSSKHHPLVHTALRTLHASLSKVPPGCGGCAIYCQPLANLSPSQGNGFHLCYYLSACC